MRIAHVISTPEGFGGAERVAGSLVKAALDAGHEVLLLNPFAVDPSSSRLRLAVRPAVYRGRPVRGIFDLPRIRNWLLAQILEFQPDVVHAHLFHAAALTATLPRTCPRILTHHHGAVFDSLGQRSKEAVDRAAGRRFDRIVAVSESVERFLIDSYGYSSGNITCIPNGWMGNPKNAQEDHPLIVCAANLRAEKGHQVLIGAMALVSHRFPRARLLLLGEGPLRTHLEEQVRRLRLSHVVHFKGSVLDVWEWYARASIAVMPSLYEPLGIAALEAMAAGVPVVATCVGGLPELVLNGETGILIPPNNSAAMAEAVIRLIASPAMARRMGDAGRVRAAEFSMKRMTDAYLQLYDQVA